MAFQRTVTAFCSPLCRSVLIFPMFCCCCFQVDPTVQPVTRGVALYPGKSAAPGATEPALIYADTFGLFSPGNPEELDARLISAMTLMSSTLIYNHLGMHVRREDACECLLLSFEGACVFSLLSSHSSLPLISSPFLSPPFCRCD